MSKTEVEGLIRGLCDEPDADVLAAAAVAAGVSDSEDLRLLLEGIGHGAEQLCPDVAAENPALINDAHTAALALIAG